MVQFSVITPVLNGKKYLEECIQSVLRVESREHSVEHIIVDGGSTDTTIQILESYHAQYPNQIRFISEPDKGPGDAINKGMKMATGEIVSLLPADDLMMPNAIQAVADFFQKNKEASFVYGGCDIINGKGKVINRVRGRDFDLEEMICGVNFIPCPSAFYRREVAARVGQWSDKGEDRYYWARVGRVFRMHRIEETLSCFRVHNGSQDAQESIVQSVRRILDGYKVVRNYSGSPFSKCCRRYWEVTLVEVLRPVLGFSYPLLRRVLHAKSKEQRAKNTGE